MTNDARDAAECRNVLHLRAKGIADLSLAEGVFTHFPITIGRDPLNALCIPSPYVSAFHAAIEERQGRVVLTDLGSSNGVFIGGERIAPHAPIDITADAISFVVGPVLVLGWYRSGDERPSGILGEPAPTIDAARRP